MRIFELWFYPMPHGLAGHSVEELFRDLEHLVKLGDLPTTQLRQPDCPKDREDKFGAILGLNALAVRQAESILLLIRNRFSDQAGPIARALYETSLNSIACQESATEFIDFHACINKRLLNCAKEDKSGWGEHFLRTEPVEKIEAEYSEYTKKYPAKFEKSKTSPSSWQSKTLDQLAQNFDFGVRQIYQWLCSSSHSNVQAVRDLFSIHEPTQGYYLKPNDHDATLLIFTLCCLTATLQVSFNVLQNNEQLRELEKINEKYK